MATYKSEAIKCFIRPRSLGNETDKVTINPDSPHKLTAKDKQFTFDGIFQEDATQLSVYEKVVKPYLDDFFNGYTYTVISYGPNGSGKSYTMFGCNKPSANHEGDFVGGLVPFAGADIFTRIETMRYIEYTLKLSLVEIYNEEIHDLLNAENGLQCILTGNSDSRHPKIVREAVVNSSSEFNKLLTKTIKHRHSETSPSHIILTISLYSKSSDNQLHPVGRLQFVDLVGLSKDTRNVNKSLFTLNRCIQALNDKKHHIPYRESKLTHFLQDSLGGNTRTTFVVTIFNDFNDDLTIRSLEFAQKVRDIVNVPERMRNCNEKSLQLLQEQIKKYHSDINAARLANGVYVDAAEHAQLVNNLDSSKRAYLENITGIKELQAEVKQVRESIVESNSKLQSLDAEYKILCDDLRQRRKVYLDEQARVVEEQHLVKRYEEQEKMLKDFTSLLQVSNKNLREEEDVLLEKIDKQIETNKMYNKCTKDVFETVLNNYESFNENLHNRKRTLTKVCNNVSENVEDVINVVRELDKEPELEAFEDCVNVTNGFEEFFAFINHSNEVVMGWWKNFLNSITSESFVQEMNNECEKIQNQTQISFERLREYWKQECLKQDDFTRKINSLVDEIVSINVQEKEICERMENVVKETRDEREEVIKLLKNVKISLSEAVNKYKSDQQSHSHTFLSYFKDNVQTMVNNFIKKIHQKCIEFKREGDKNKELETNLLKALLNELSIFYDRLNNDVYSRLEEERLLLLESNAHVYDKVINTLENLRNLDSRQDFTKHLIHGTETKTKRYVEKCEEAFEKGKEIVQPLNKTGNTPVYNEKCKLLSKVQQGTPRSILANRFHEKVNLGELSVCYNESSMLLDNSTTLVEDIDEH